MTPLAAVRATAAARTAHDRTVMGTRAAAVWAVERLAAAVWVDVR